MHFARIDAVYHEACDVFNPEWNGETISEWQEALVLASHPVSITLVIFSAFAVWRRSLWIALATSLLWAIWTGHVFFDDMLDDARRTAADLGCVGHSTLFIGLAIALCAGMTLYTACFCLWRSHLRRH